MTSTLTGRELATRVMEAMANGDLDAFRELVHPDGTNRESVVEPPQCRGPGPEAWHATAQWLRTMFSELRWELHEAISDGDLAACHVTMRGRHTGELVRYDAAGDVAARYPATGLAFAATQTHWFRIVDGLVIEHWANRDDMGVNMQLGLVSVIRPS